jgi:methylated-DNA-[protein]-cysteine S-methyltransferase
MEQVHHIEPDSPERTDMALPVAYYFSPLGLIEITASPTGIASVSFVEHKRPGTSEPHPLLDRCVAQLGEYFNAGRSSFDLPLDPRGTEFQQAVWQELCNIPFGKTISYLDLALKVGDKNSTRAVGSANGKNPIGLIVPCHRVIGNDGKLTGYAGGLWRKQWLLEHEGVLDKSTQISLF